MKTKIFVTITLLSALAFSTNFLFAQRGLGQEKSLGLGMKQEKECRIPDVTPEQDSKIKVLRTKHLKEVTPLRNELQEKRARLNSLQSADRPDLNAINKAIDEMAALKGNLIKKHAAHRAEVASILTETQRVHFNARNPKGMDKRKRDHGAHCQQ